MLTKFQAYSSSKMKRFKARLERLSTPKRPEGSILLQLPLELRQEILKIAFGNRTMHAVLVTTVRNSRRYLNDASEKNKKPVREWTGSTCQCQLAQDEEFWAHLAHDQCVQDRADLWISSGRDSPLCCIGAMGWLLTCRQAYTEGMHILYSTNTFRISPVGLNVGPPRLPGSPGRADIRSVEMVLKLYVFPPTKHCFGSPPYIPDRVRLSIDMLDSLHGDLPNLRRLYVGIGTELSFARTPRDAKGQFFLALYEILRPMDSFALKMLGAGLEEFELGLPTCVFHAMFMIGTEAGGRFQSPGWKTGADQQGRGSWHSRKRVWRAIQGPDGHGEGGYWVSETESDIDDGHNLVDLGRYWE